MSSSVKSLPIEILIVEPADSSDIPVSVRDEEGLAVPEEQADPNDAPIPSKSRLMIISFPFMPSNVRLITPGILLSPLRV